MSITLGQKTLELPLLQGGMGIGVSRCRLAGAVAHEGAMGVISAAQIGYDQDDFRLHPKARICGNCPGRSNVPKPWLSAAG